MELEVGMYVRTKDGYIDKNDDKSIWLESGMSAIEDEKILEPLVDDLIKDGLVEKVEE